MSKGEKIYYIRVSEYELESIEGDIRKYIIDKMTTEINQHSKELAEQILSGKPLTKKKWYQTIDEAQS